MRANTSIPEIRLDYLECGVTLRTELFSNSLAARVRGDVGGALVCESSNKKPASSVLGAPLKE